MTRSAHPPLVAVPCIILICSCMAALLPAAEPTSVPVQTSTTASYTPMPTTQPNGDLTTPPAVHVQPIPDDLRRDYKLNPFWVKYVIVRDIPIVSSSNCSDYALLECAWTLDHLLNGRAKALDALVKGKVRVGIIAATEFTMDIPENQRPGMLARAAYNDRRSRGLGGMPFATCAEENLLNLRGDPYARENITIHEFSHTVASAIRRVDRDWWDRLTA